MIRKVSPDAAATPIQRACEMAAGPLDCAAQMQRQWIAAMFSFSSVSVLCVTDPRIG